MKLRTILLVLFILFIAGFVALNFEQILQPTALNFGFTQVQAPMGLVLLGMLALVLVVFLAALVYYQTLHLVEVRRVTREAADQRVLADKAEASRFTELRQYLQGELQATAVREKELADQVQLKLDQVQAALTQVVEQTGNGLSATVGELEDRLERHYPPRGGSEL
ncbi:LapA family protein [Hydrogenophaga palleronii]|uniref:LapA family protein n=1 Tax=Hydrogenophaga palleronii TaxID=65655 RepID=UPI000826F388|nr:LapA family protein [Hydrogenophaga palleronii]